MRIPATRNIRLLLIALLPLSGQALADTCAEVVEDTLAELRAGASGPWSEEQEKLIRSAAGSACVKASSGRYDRTPAMPAPAPAAEPASASPAPAAAAAAAPSEEADDGSWSAGGLTFRSLNGSPAKKPYERQREQKKGD